MNASPARAKRTLLEDGLNVTHCFRSIMKSKIQFLFGVERSNDTTLLPKMLWSIRSNAFLKPNSTERIAVPGVSVADNHSRSIDIKFKVADDFGTTPNSLGSKIFKIASFNSRSRTKSSATLDITDVSEIRRKCLCQSVTCLTFGKGEILALFHYFGNFSARKEQFKSKLTGYAKISAKYLRNHMEQFCQRLSSY